MKITVHLLAVGVALGLAGDAGATATSLPMITSAPGATPRRATGALSDARREERKLDCWVIARPGSVSMGCDAQLSDGSLISCTSSDPMLVLLATLVRGDSDIRFQVEPSGECRSFDGTGLTEPSESYPKTK